MKCEGCKKLIKTGEITVGYDIGEVEKDGTYSLGCLPVNFCLSCARGLPHIQNSIERALTARERYKHKTIIRGGKMYILTEEPKGGILVVAFRVLDDAFGTEEFDYTNATSALDNSEVPSPLDTFDRLVNAGHITEV